MNKNVVPILLVVLCTFLTASGQFLIKLGTVYIVDFLSVFNFSLILGFVLYGFGAVVLVLALRFGDLSTIYPFIALSFVWVFLISIFFLHELILFWNWVGLFFILLGVGFIGLGADAR